MTLLTLFSGGGLVELGLRGVRVVGAVELDPEIAAHYEAAHGLAPVVGDAREVDYRLWAGVDHLHASPPCTRASVANPNAGETDLDRELAAAVLRAVDETGPRIVTVENVAPYAKFESFQAIVDGLQARGYNVHHAVYNAADYGVPQTRRRLILRAWRGEYGPVPVVEPTHQDVGKMSAAPAAGSLFDDNLTLPWVGWYEAVEDLLPTCPESALADWQIKRLPESLREHLLLSGTTVHGESPAPKEGRRDASPVVAGNVAVRAVLIRNQGEDSEIAMAADGPAPTIRSTVQSPLRAVLVGDQAAAGGRGVLTANADAPAHTVLCRAGGGTTPRAVLVNGTSTMETREADVPSASVLATVGTKAAMPKAVLVDGTEMRRGEGICRADSLPAATVKANPGGNGNKPRALTLPDCRVVAMTPRCLARFQGVPDSYPLPAKRRLATLIIGNGVPPPLMAALVGPMLARLEAQP